MTSVEQASPHAFGGSRLGWADLPRAVRARIADIAGAEVISETGATNGFSPGYAAVLELGDGTRVFVKAVSPEQNPDSPNLARSEIRVAERLPDGVPAPRLLWSDDDGAWVLLGFEAVEGRSPERPWRGQDLDRVLEALVDLAEAGSPSPPGLRALSRTLSDSFAGWRRLADAPADLERAVAAVGEHGGWMLEHLDDLVTWAEGGALAAAGDTLVHGDLRGDNVLLGPRHVWLIDWPHACGHGVAWYDLLAMLPSVAMQGGGDPHEIFWKHPNAHGADRESVRAVLAGVTSFFVHGSVQPPPQGIPNLRTFQLAQGMAALDWLRRF
ncbi:aminoglycoside phosphotransferase family protein [Actinotalea sp. K2]|uniref:phosphotransferase family protein n=1 Tax=Actinotalea sp. K2 TaxID=2939438 RepID=UPI002016F104|nr:aminoglycoside phosphotransferase family protein [Actinotalea sp. K2]MCL3860481.1 aminoglycoside phosphotransferase family protein [Actinotalea sp. K2]